MFHREILLQYASFIYIFAPFSHSIPFAADLPETWIYLRITVLNVTQFNSRQPFPVRSTRFFYLFIESEFRVYTNVASAELNRAKREWISGLVNWSNFSFAKCEYINGTKFIITTECRSDQEYLTNVSTRMIVGSEGAASSKKDKAAVRRSRRYAIAAHRSVSKFVYYI